MGHKLSTNAQAANDSASTRTLDLVVITLPDPLAAETLYLATADVTIHDQGDREYQGAIRSMPQIVYSSGGNANSGEFTIENVSNLYGPTFLTSDRVIDGAQVVITRAFKLDDDTWETSDPVTGLPYELARGILKTQPVDDETVKCNFVVDISDSSVNIGGASITQHCPKTFNLHAGVNHDGADHPWGGACGWQESMFPGGISDAAKALLRASCDYTNDGPNGCKAHGNTRFGGVPGLTPNAAATATGAVKSGAVGSGSGRGASGDGNGGYGQPIRKLLLLDIDLRYPT